MPFSYSAGTLTVTAGSEGAPNLLSDGIDTVNTSDVTRGERKRCAQQGWLNNVIVKIAQGAWLKFDNDWNFGIYGSTYFAHTAEARRGSQDGSAIIHGERSTLYINGNTVYHNAAALLDGCIFISNRDSNGVNPRVILDGPSRMDYFTQILGLEPYRLEVSGLDIIRLNSIATFHKLYVGQVEDSGKFLNNLLVDVNGIGSWQIASGSILGTFTTTSLDLNGESTASYNIVNNPIFNLAADGAITGYVRRSSIDLFNATFPGAGEWNGVVSWGSAKSGLIIQFFYDNNLTVKIGLTAVNGARCLWTRTNLDNVDWTPATADEEADTTDSNGEASNSCLDAHFRTSTAVDRYDWQLEIRHYDYLTPADSVYVDREFAAHANGVGGEVTEEIQVLADAGITGTEAAAQALITTDNLDDMYDVWKEWHTNTAGHNVGRHIFKSGSIQDFGANDVVIDAGAVVIIDVTGSILTFKPALVLDLGSTFTGIKTSNNITYITASIAVGMTLEGTVFLNAEQDLTDVVIIGDLHINIAANVTLDFSNVNVSGNVFNDATGNTLTINSSGGSSLTAGDTGTGNGETDVQNPVALSVTVIDDDTGLVIATTARVYIEDASHTERLNSATDVFGVASNTINYEGTPVPIVGWAREMSSTVVDYEPKDFTGTINENGFSTTVRLTPLT